MATVSLKELGDHLRGALDCVNKAVDSTEAEPELDFEGVRKSLRSALGLLGEGSGGTAADSASAKLAYEHSFESIFEPLLHRHPYRNHEQ